MAIEETCAEQSEERFSFIEHRSRRKTVMNISSIQSEDGAVENMNGSVIFTKESLCMDLRSFDKADTEMTALPASNDEKETLDEDLSIENEIITMAEDTKEGSVAGPETFVEQHLGSIFSVESRSQRISLLGHGPHGKKVVEMILQEEGEYGIARFCQRWRAVFVESLKPTHLPHGWDILHRFGSITIILLFESTTLPTIETLISCDDLICLFFSNS